MKRAALLILTLAPLLVSCAYWNTFYLARKSYDRATLGDPYIVEPGQSTNTSQDFLNSIKYSKKVLSQYPKSKWVPAAYLLWARALIGRQDPIEAANMLSSFSTRFPKSSLKPEATFYLGVAYRQGHKPTEALTALDEFLAQRPKDELAPYALLERSRALASLDRKQEAADAAGKLIDRFPNHSLVRTARIERADALYDLGQFGPAREDYKALGLEAVSDEERFRYLLREADCVEGAHEYDAEIQLLKGALAHEVEPVVTTQTTATGATIATAPTAPGADRWGRLRVRIGTAHMLAGRLAPAVEEYTAVLAIYPHTPLAAEAQYRMGYAYETVAEDFDRARDEYGKVKDISTQGGFSQQATQRLTNLDRLASFGKAAGRDSTARKAEAGFLLAELYLFQHDRPEKALDQYRKIEQDYRGTPWAGKAINAQAWLLSRKMDKKSTADSLFWRVIHEYPATEAQLAARDYLEGEGIRVADSLIEAPRELIPVLPQEADTLRLTPPPPTTPKLGEPAGGVTPAQADSLNHLNARRGLPGSQPPGMPPRGMPPGGMPPDSLAHGAPPAPPDTSGKHP